MKLHEAWMFAVALMLVTGMLGCSAEPDAGAKQDSGAKQDTGQEAAIAEVKNLCGKVRVDQERFGKPVVEVDLNGTEVTDAGLVHLKGLTQLQTLGLSFTKVIDEGIKKLQEALPNCKIEH